MPQILGRFTSDVTMCDALRDTDRDRLKIRSVCLALLLCTFENEECNVYVQNHSPFVICASVCQCLLFKDWSERRFTSCQLVHHGHVQQNQCLGVPCFPRWWTSAAVQHMESAIMELVHRVAKPVLHGCMDALEQGS